MVDSTTAPSGPSFGVNQGVWEYYDVNNNLLGYVVRYEKNGKKEFRPFTFQGGQWVKKWWPSTDADIHKPLYNAQLLTKHPNKPVLIVEGEKAADKAQELLPDYVVISWLGGANAVKKVNISPLAGRKVYAWPDNDEPGKKAMTVLLNRIASLDAEIIPVCIDGLQLPEKWDLGDFDEEYGDIDLELIKLTIAGSKPKPP